MDIVSHAVSRGSSGFAVGCKVYRFVVRYSMNVALPSPRPKDREQAVHPFVVLILLNCATLKFVSYTSNLLEQMYDFQQRTMFHPK